MIKMFIFDNKMFIFDNKMSVFSAEDSVSTSQPPDMSTAPMRDLKAKIKSIKTGEKLIEHCLENVELISTVSTSLLNSWNPIDGYKYYKRHGIIHVGKSESTTYAKNKALLTRIEQLESRVAHLEQLISQVSGNSHVPSQQHQKFPEYGYG
jgi:hypothetical protein